MPDQIQQSYEFRAEIQQLLHILVHSLYTDREIFLRELISNASDALSRVQFEMLTNQDVLDIDAELAVHIAFDQKGYVTSATLNRSTRDKDFDAAIVEWAKGMKLMPGSAGEGDLPLDFNIP